MIRAVAILSLVILLILVLYVPSAHPPERFLAQLRDEHQIATGYWGPLSATHMLDRAVRMQEATTNVTPIPAAKDAPSTSAVNGAVLLEMTSVNQRLFNNPYFRSVDALLLLASYRLSTLLEWLPLLSAFVLAAIADGGFRYSLSGEWAKRGESSQTNANVWWLRSGLDLWSNFQYCLNDYDANGNCNTGDQFMQGERRNAGGFSISHALYDKWGGLDVTNSFGLQSRIDKIKPVGLYNTTARTTYNTVREDNVTQRSIGFWAQNETRWTSWFRSTQGLRADAYDFTVDSNIAANSGIANDQMVTPKLSLIFGPWQKTELYLNYGHGFHSNDARGTTISCKHRKRLTTSLFPPSRSAKC